MIYVDSSVALAHLLTESRRPPTTLWEGSLAASRLIEYEIWTRLHAYDLTKSHGDAATGLIGRIVMTELAPPVLERVLEGFPVPVRTLDALHLATFEFLRKQGQVMELASFDRRTLTAARAMGMAIFDMDSETPNGESTAS